MIYKKSFINSHTESVPTNIKKLLSMKQFEYVVFTKFINDTNSQYYNTLNYKGCMTEEDRKIVLDTKNYKVIEKKVYTALNDELNQYIKDNNIDEIYVCGIDTDACVMKTALDLFENNYNVKVIEDCSMSHSGADIHNNAVGILKKLIGKENVIKMLESVNND